MKNTSTTVQNITVITSPRMCLNTANFTTCVNTAKIDMTWASEVRGKYHCHVCNTISLKISSSSSPPKLQPLNVFVRKKKKKKKKKKQPVKEIRDKKNQIVVVCYRSWIKKSQKNITVTIVQRDQIHQHSNQQKSN